MSVLTSQPCLDPPTSLVNSILEIMSVCQNPSNGSILFMHLLFCNLGKHKMELASTRLSHIPLDTLCSTAQLLQYPTNIIFVLSTCYPDFNNFCFSSSTISAIRFNSTAYHICHGKHDAIYFLNMSITMTNNKGLVSTPEIDLLIFETSVRPSPWSIVLWCMSKCLITEWSAV